MLSPHLLRGLAVEVNLGSLDIAVGDPQCGNPEVIILDRKPSDGSELPDWKAELSKPYRTVPRIGGGLSVLETEHSRTGHYSKLR